MFAFPRCQAGVSDWRNFAAAVQEFCDRSGLPYVIFQATRGRSPAAERADFTTAIAQSSLPDGELVAGTRPEDWNHALRTLVAALPSDALSIAVIDEVPWIVERKAAPSR